jgi:hypothetical protein
VRLEKLIEGIHKELQDAQGSIVSGVWNGLCIAVCIWGFILFDTLSATEGTMGSVWIVVVLVVSPYIVYLMIAFLRLFRFKDEVEVQIIQDIDNPMVKENCMNVGMKFLVT